MRVIDRVAVPALIITAEDDPFVPHQPFRDPAVTGNAHIALSICEHGGHCGFVGAPSAADDGYWAETQIVSFVAEHAGTTTTQAEDPKLWFETTVNSR